MTLRKGSHKISMLPFIVSLLCAVPITLSQVGMVLTI